MIRRDNENECIRILSREVATTALLKVLCFSVYPWLSSPILVRKKIESGCNVWESSYGYSDTVKAE